MAARSWRGSAATIGPMDHHDGRRLLASADLHRGVLAAPARSGDADRLPLRGRGDRRTWGPAAGCSAISSIGATPVSSRWTSATYPAASGFIDGASWTTCPSRHAILMCWKRS